MDDYKCELARIKKFYDEVYHAQHSNITYVPWHLRKLAKKIHVKSGQKILDVACGTGQWLMSAAALKALPSGVDISQKAIDTCRMNLPNADLFCGPAEKLPFPDFHFDVVTCLGALEHFVDPHKALLEMARVAQPTAKFLFLVPNSDFLTAKLGFYKGTHQSDIKEEARTIEEWNTFFIDGGLQIVTKWKDLHILNWAWITRGPTSQIPFRFIQATILPFWPLRWQYQIYFLCQKQNK